jgi:tRNA(Ile2) C34 agmatinyltransferase TiaS
MFEHFFKNHQRKCERCEKLFLPSTTRQNKCSQCRGISYNKSTHYHTRKATKKIYNYPMYGGLPKYITEKLAKGREDYVK